MAISEFVMSLLSQFSRMTRSIYDLLSSGTQSTFSYKLEEIDFKANKVIIRCRGLRTVIKTSIEEAVYDYSLIQGLSPVEACMLGGYLGRYLRVPREANQAESKKANHFSFLLSNNFLILLVSVKTWVLADSNGVTEHPSNHTSPSFTFT